MSMFSNFLNSFLQILPFSWIPGNDKKNNFPTISSIATGMIERQHSTREKPSNKLIDATGQRYVYDIDTCQTAYLVEKKSGGTYHITILYTKETDPLWLEAKLNVIMLRILIAERIIPVLDKIFDRERGWKIIGSIDCQRDRSYSVNAFHQDSLLSAFIDDAYRDIFDNFLNDIFSPRPEFFSPIVFPGVSLGIDLSLDPNNFPVYSHNTAHFGILDYDSIAKIIAAAIKTGDHIFLATFPPSTNFFRPFLFYLNSIIHHATPSSLTQDEINEILAYYTANPGLLPEGFTALQGGGTITGGAQEGSLKKALENYNNLFNKAKNYPRSFRRLLGKILPTNAIWNNPSVKRKRLIIKRTNIINKYDKIKNSKIFTTASEAKKKTLDFQMNEELRTSDKSIEQMTEDLKREFRSRSIVYDETTSSHLKRVTEQINDQYTEFKDNMALNFSESRNRAPKRKDLKGYKLSPPKEEFKVKQFSQTVLPPDYFVYTERIFDRDAITKLKKSIEFFKYTTSASPIPHQDVEDSIQSPEPTRIEFKPPEEVNLSDADKIEIIKISTGALQNRGGRSKHNKSKRQRNTKKKHNKLKKRKQSQKKNNKKRRSKKR